MELQGRLLQVVFFIVTFKVTPSQQGINEKQNISVAVLLPKYNGRGPAWPFFLEMVLPAIDIANRTIISKGILPNHRYTILPGDSHCKSTEAVIWAVESNYEHFTDVFFGPACDYSVKTVASFLARKNTPIVTVGAQSMHFDKTRGDLQSKLITRVHGTNTKFAEFVAQYLEATGWNNILLILEDNDSDDRTCWTLMGSLHSVLGERNFTRAPAVTFLYGTKRSEIDSIVLDIQTQSRSKYGLNQTWI